VFADIAVTCAPDEQQAFMRELDALSLADSKQQSCARRANHIERVTAVFAPLLPEPR
jgi:hypothetical protein